MSKGAAASLNELMIKNGMKPEYDLIQKNDGTHANEFVIRVKCPLVPGGPLRYADGLGHSKKEAKRQAAQSFLQKFISNGDNGGPSQAPIFRKLSQCAVNVNSSKIHKVLQMICDKHSLGSPLFEELGSTGPSHSKNFTSQCRVSDLTVKGMGSTKREAKLNAATEMIKVLMQQDEAYEIFESLESMPSEHNGEIVCLTNNLDGSQVPQPTGIFYRRRSSVASSISSSHIETPCRQLLATRSTSQHSTASTLFNVQINSARVADSNDNSNSNTESVDSVNNGKKISAGTIRRTKSLTNLSEGVKISKTKESETITRIGSKIESTLKRVERILYDEIRDNLVSKHARIEKQVVILHHEYEIFINAVSDRPEIREGESECDDSSIRIACLSKLLVDLKNHIKKHKKC